MRRRFRRLSVRHSAAAPPSEREPAAPARATARSNAEGAAGALRGAGWQSNSNLVEISDWLTKIIVGLGLIHLKDVPSAAQRLAGHVAAGFGDAAPAQQFEAFLMALLIAFTLLGFVTGYLYTRIFLQGALRRAEDAMLRAEQQQAVSDKLDREIADAGSDIPPSAWQPRPMRRSRPRCLRAASCSRPSACRSGSRCRRAATPSSTR